MKPWLIAHRGARCDGRGNTLKAFEATKKYPLGAVELDIHTTKDNIVICHHDPDVRGKKIIEHTYRQLKKLDPELTTFADAVKAVGQIPLIVEIKPIDTAKNILEYLKQNPKWRVASFKIEELKYLLDAGIVQDRLYLLQRDEPFSHISRAIKAGIGGVSLNHGYVSPIWYWRAKRHKLNMYVFTVNRLWVARLIRIFYPKINICTDRPDLLQKIN
jgi:glycerophosphoryl diester phosphodiesterase